MHPPALIRDYREGDLGRVVSLWEDYGLLPVGSDGLTVDEATDVMASEDAVVRVAERDGDIVGVALGTVAGALGVLFRVVGEDETCQRLLDDVEGSLAERATNWVSRLDPALLRPGRFDDVLPVGPPNAEARRAMWQGYVEDITDQDIDVEVLGEASARFTPADIEFAARKAAQFAFEQDYFGGSDRRATIREFLAAIDQTPPSLTEEMIETFERDRDRSARY